MWWHSQYTTSFPIFLIHHHWSSSEELQCMVWSCCVICAARNPGGKAFRTLCALCHSWRIISTAVIAGYLPATSHRCIRRCRQWDGCGVRQEMTVAEYCTWWRCWHNAQQQSQRGTAAADGCGGFHPSMDRGASNTATEEVCPASACDCSLWYLKDWHFSTDFPDYKARGTVHVTADDV